MFTPRTQLCCLRCLSCCFNLYNSQLHLSVVPLVQRLALRVLVRPAAVVLDGEHLRSGRISMHPAGLLGRCVFGGADLTVFSCGKHKHTVGQSVLVVQTHTNRLSHFSFFLPANFLHFSFFLPANFLHLLFFLPANFLHLLFPFLLTFCTCFFSFLLTFCTCFLSLLSTSLSQPSTSFSQQSTVCSHF